jgi:hypothetical protein
MEAISDSKAFMPRQVHFSARLTGPPWLRLEGRTCMLELKWMLFRYVT